jgi:phosphoribosyl 1,2-cyclic phosphodiesterase
MRMRILTTATRVFASLGGAAFRRQPFGGLVKLTFLGTRGEIEARTARHGMHTSLRVSYRGRSVVIDCGLDWRGRLAEMGGRAIVVTHAHPDHAFGLQDGSPVPVFATVESWAAMRRYPIPADRRRRVIPRKPFEVAGITLEAFPVVHSIRAPAVGYRIRAGRATVFYVPDLVFIPDRAEALRGVRLYIGDGASLTRPLVRRRGDVLFGHTPVRTQLTWCQHEGVGHAIITHCGSQIVTGDEGLIRAAVERMAEERGVRAEIAYDGMEVVVR